MPPAAEAAGRAFARDGPPGPVAPLETARRGTGRRPIRRLNRQLNPFGRFEQAHRQGRAGQALRGLPGGPVERRVVGADVEGGRVTGLGFGQGGFAGQGAQNRRAAQPVGQPVDQPVDQRIDGAAVCPALQRWPVLPVLR